MSLVLELTRPAQPHQHATYRVQCAGCRRVYVTTRDKAGIRKLKACQACRPRSWWPKSVHTSEAQRARALGNQNARKESL